MVAAPLPPTFAPAMDRARPAGLPGSQQLRIPTPQDLERMRAFRQQQQQRHRQAHAPPQRLTPQPQPQQGAAPPQQTQPPPPAPGAAVPGQWQPQRQQTGTAPPQRLQQGAAPQRQQLQQAGGPPGAPQRQQGPPGMPQRQQGPPGMPQRQQAPPGAPPRQGFAPQRQGFAPPQQQGRRPARPAPKDDLFTRLAEECGLEDAWRPQVLLLYELGLRPSDFDRLAESRPEIFQMGIVTMRRKLKFLQDTIGLSNAQLAKVISKFPRILEYRSERTLRPRLDFLARCGVSQDDLAKVFVKAPMVLELSVKDTLEPRAAFLRKTLRLPADSLGKLIVRHPQVLTCTEDMMAQRVEFLLQQGLSQEEVGRAVLAHPQVLHYKIDSMRERVDYLHNVGLTQAQVAACAHRFPQLFSLDVAANLDPKWRYLTDYICASGADCVDTLCSYPGYFSLSLTNRVVPRHRFFLHTAPKRGASPDPAQLVFPMNALKCSDAQFVKLCGSSLEEYEQFREVLFGGTQPPPSVHPSAVQPER